MNTTTWSAECSRIYQLTGRALAVVLLCVCVGQPVQAQGFFEKAQKATRAVQDRVQRVSEKADSALSKADQTAGAIECLASDTNCVEKANAEGQAPVAADSSGRAFPSSG